MLGGWGHVGTLFFMVFYYSLLNVFIPPANVRIGGGGGGGGDASGCGLEWGFLQGYFYVWALVAFTDGNSQAMQDTMRAGVIRSWGMKIFGVCGCYLCDGAHGTVRDVRKTGVHLYCFCFVH